jgi:transketolase
MKDVLPSLYEESELPDSALDQLGVNALRVLAIDAIQQANSGHPGLPLGAAPMAYVLWTRYLKHNPANPAWPNRDRFVLSAGHGSMLLYALLYLTGYDLTLEDVKRFRQLGSRTPGHPEYGVTPGVETTTGPLGQGFAAGVGMAIAERFLAAHFNQPGYPIVDHYTYGLVSDGDLMEGISAEAASLAGHLGLGKLIYLYDQNSISLAGETILTFTEDVTTRFVAYGWHVEQVEDGNDLSALAAALERARAEELRPSLICVRTHIGYGSPKQDSYEAHGAPLGKEEVRLTRRCLRWPWQEPFAIPAEVLARLRRVRERGMAAETAWQELLQRYRRTYPELAAEHERVLAGELPANWETLLPSFAAESGPLATRRASGKVLAALASSCWNLVGGSADLNPSTSTLLVGRGDFQAPHRLARRRGSEADRPEEPAHVQGAAGGEWGWAGQNLHFGVREHAMGAILNGLALHGGIIPYGATFLVFSDYLRPALRLAALMRLSITYIFTHDSIAVGEDGPTHQPVEHLAALRAIPGLTVIRPADANEVVWAWRVALTSRTGPVALILSRQDLPIFDRQARGLGSAEGLTRGAYILAEKVNRQSDLPDIILIGTGSEVALCLEAHELLAASGIHSRVVSMPSWELFDEQAAEYQRAVLGPQHLPRLVVEAGIALGWGRYLGQCGAVLSMERFGASAPGKELLHHFGFTAEQILQRALDLLEHSARQSCWTD